MPRSVDAQGISTPSTNNSNLSAAKKAKNDEFYTQWVDIEKEMNAYLDYDPDVFRDKTILLPCDDPEWSNFTKYFALNFTDYGIKRLISTSYAPDSKPDDVAYQPSLFEEESPQFDPAVDRSRGKKFVLDHVDVNGDGVVNFDDLQWEYLEGDGDFRSEEVTALRDEADMVITNPPFSLFREFMAWLIAGDVEFAVIGNKNAITYKEIFPFIMNNGLWSGATPWSGGKWFELPLGAEKVDAYENETPMGNVPSIWLTNIEHGRRHQPLTLMTMEENTRFSSHKEIKGIGYKEYDNYDAIEVPFTIAIPSDYDGVMGVPISFLDKYNPDQFEILGATESEGKGFSNGIWDATSGTAQPLVNDERRYKRIFIRHQPKDDQ